MPMRMPMSASSRLRTRPPLSLSKYFQTKLKLRWYCTMGPSLLGKTPHPALSPPKRGEGSDLSSPLSPLWRGEGWGEGRALPSKYRKARLLLGRLFAEDLLERGGVDLGLMAVHRDVEAGVDPLQPVGIALT